MGLPVLLVGLHLLSQFFLCHLDEVVVFLNGFLDHLPLMFSLLCQVLQKLSFLVLVEHGGRRRPLKVSMPGCVFSITT